MGFGVCFRATSRMHAVTDADRRPNRMAGRDPRRPRRLDQRAVLGPVPAAALGDLGRNRGHEACAPAAMFGIRGIWIKGFDLRPIRSIQRARSNAVCRVPSLRLNAAKAIGLASVGARGRWRGRRGDPPARRGRAERILA